MIAQGTRSSLFFFVILQLLCCSFAASQDSIRNPILPSGADPWVIRKDGFYYYTHTTGRNLVLYKVKNFEELQTTSYKVIWEPPVGMQYSKQLWAPELHYINKKWYFYFAADDGDNNNHRVYVLENGAADPYDGEWKLIGKVNDRSDKWAIDASVFQYKHRWYMIWSGWEGEVNGTQNIYIARMKNPWSIRGDRVLISTPELAWERFGDLHDAQNPPHVSVNEGPQFLQNGKRMFIIYSASGCWTDQYGLGMLSLSGKNLLKATNWRKSVLPVFSTSAADSVFAPGHNSFFKSPDGKENWILYHANSSPGAGCGERRSPRAQRFTWKPDGTPDFGKPVRTGSVLPAPGEIER